jgi:hypothetical protein
MMVDRLAAAGSPVSPLGPVEIEAGPGRRSLTGQVYDVLPLSLGDVREVFALLVDSSARVT